MNIEKITKILDNINDGILVLGISAGPDSMALLHIVKNNSNKKIVCAHINHNIRKESIEEEQYLKNYCLKENIIFESLKITKYKENNFENEARKYRYNFFEKILKKYNSKSLILAHHGDDLIETVLMKMIRGSNIEGYSGIKLYSKLDNYTIIRPLLYVTKKDIINYNNINSIKYFIDISNSDISYTRNRIRKNILPILKEEDQNIHKKFLYYSNELQEYYNYVERLVKNKINTIYQNNIINIDVFNEEEEFIKKNIIFHILSNIYNNNSNIIKNKHIEDIIKLSSNNKPNILINLPNNYIAIKNYNFITFKKNISNSNSYKIKLKETNIIDNICIKKLTNKELNNLENNNGNNICLLNSKTINLPLYIRNKKNGDKISTLGLNGTKKISDIFIEKKIPKEKRSSYPLVVDSKDNIIWIPHIKKSKYNAKINESYDIILYSYYKGGDYEEKNK